MALELFGPKLGEKGVVGGTDTADVEFLFRGTNDIDEMIAYLDSNISASYLGLVAHNYTYESIGFELFKINVPYQLCKAPSAPQNKRATGSIKITRDISGGTQNVKQSLETMASYASDANVYGPASYGNSMNVSLDGASSTVNGTDVYIPNSTITIEYNCPNATADETYFELVDSLMACTNSSPFNVSDGKISVSRPVGEVLFVGFTASERNEDDLSLSFKYLLSKNATGLTIGDMTVDKKGWEYVWATYKKIADSGNLPTVPWEVFVERVYNGGSLLDVLPS